MKFYISGTGSFAEKLAATLLRNQLTIVSFIDEFRTKPLLSLPVYQASELLEPDNGDIVFIAISHNEYAKNARQRLIDRGIKSEQIIILFYDSCAVLLAQMLCQNYDETLRCIRLCQGSFLTLENMFYPLDKTHKEQSTISFRMLSRGGNYYSHLANLPQALSDTHNVSICSDEPVDQVDKTQMFSQQRMLETESDIVISPQLFICSPAKTTKITLTHAIYDSVMFRDSIVETLAQPDNHYIAIPSKASFEQHKKICIENKLTNNIVLMPVGYPKFDVNLQKYRDMSTGIAPDAILYAPTQSATRKPNADFGYSIDHAISFLKKLSEYFPDLTIIFRPHPDDLKLVKSGLQSKEVNVLSELVAFVGLLPKGEIDANNSPLESYCRAKLMISDTSSTAFTFAFTTLKPVIFYSADEDKLAQDWRETCFIRDRKQIGAIVQSPDELISSIKTFSSESANVQQRILLLREQQIFNIDSAEILLMNAISSIEKSETIAGCWSLRKHLNSIN